MNIKLTGDKNQENCINAVLNENNIAEEILDDDIDDDEEVDEKCWTKLIIVLFQMKKVTKCYLLLLRSWRICNFKTKSKSQ